MHKASSRNSSGQSLIEILVGIGVGVIIIGGVAATIALTLRSNVQNKNSQTAASLGQETINELTDLAAGNWHTIDSLTFDNTLNPPATGQYKIATTGAAFVIQSGSENFTLDGKPFTRSFVIQKVSRDPNTNDILSPWDANNEDPSTMKLVVTVSWQEGSNTANVSLSKLVTRSKNLVFVQTDWSGGSGQVQFPAPGAANNRYDSKGSNINTANPGYLKTVTP